MLTLLPHPERMPKAHHVELVFEPQDDGGYHLYAPDLPGLHTHGDSLVDASENAPRGARAVRRARARHTLIPAPPTSARG
jgi:predicted RNase H-like HicB family nuclease